MFKSNLLTILLFCFVQLTLGYDEYLTKACNDTFSDTHLSTRISCTDLATCETMCRSDCDSNDMCISFTIFDDFTCQRYQGCIWDDISGSALKSEVRTLHNSISYEVHPGQSCASEVFLYDEWGFTPRSCQNACDSRGDCEDIFLIEYADGKNPPTECTIIAASGCDTHVNKSTAFLFIKEIPETTPAPSGAPSNVPTASPTKTTNSSEGSLWEYTLISGTSYHDKMECSDWLAIHQEYDPAVTYNYLTVSSDETGTELTFTCTDSTAIANILSILKNWQNLDDVVTSCDGHDWRVGTCTDSPELVIDGSECGCASSLSIRPCHTSGQFGGAGPNTCNSPTHKMSFYFGENAPPTPFPSESPTTSPSKSPSMSPSISPTTAEPSPSPTTAEPSTSPTTTSPTNSPSVSPTKAPIVHVPLSSEWEYLFLQGVQYHETEHCSSWMAMHQDYDLAVSYNYILMSSDEPGNEIEVVCTDSTVITSILTALKNWVPEDDSAFICDGNEWRVGTCASTQTLVINGDECNCNGDLVFRPCHNAGQSGGSGLNSNTCSSPTQTLRFYVGENSPPVPTQSPSQTPTVTAPTSLSPTRSPTTLAPTTLAPTLSPIVYVPVSSTWEHLLTEGVDYSSSSKCNSWISVHSEYDATKTYNFLLASSDETGNEVEFTCRDSSAIAIILSNLKNWANGDNFVTNCDGNDWRVGSCTNSPELVINGDTSQCNCVGDLAIRPCYTGAQWGSAGGSTSNTCWPTTQTLTLYFGENEPTESPTQAPTNSPPKTTVVGTAEITYSVLNSTAREEVAQRTLEDVKAKATDSDLLEVTIKSTEESTAPLDVYNQVGNKTLFEESYEKARGCYPDCTATANVPTNDFRRRLQSSQSITVEIVFDLTEDAYNELVASGNTLEDPAFVETLAAELSVDAEDIEIEIIGGEVVVEVTVLASTEGDAPTGENEIAELIEIQNSLENATAVLVEELGSEEDSIEITTLDLCADRTCSGNGDSSAEGTNDVGCNTETGVCACIDGYVGINCAESCVCENSGVCVRNKCKCSFPYFGPRCQFAKVCGCV